MRLKQIKLAGFKSFVDPTTVPYPDNLTSIVGPNGCGKSNIIDAVRWVMGESSAKNLRGESMTDVIFNGSSARKPVGQASVELVFDNSDGQLQGEFAGYNELSIRRTVTRDSQSTYYLNGTRCRRKDITDIFLGTGLGPRSYAIIEQGMISRLIESKPQELRVFIEEAAGISKYKERRRETENRIRHTRENLDRLNDLREELGKQLSHLQRQAQSAEKFKTFKAEERHLKAELAAIRWRDLNEQVLMVEKHIQELGTEFAARSAEQQSTDTDIEKKRQLQIESNDQFNKVQGRYYGIGADIARLEQGLKHRAERKVQLNQDLSRAQISLENATEHQTIDAQKVEDLVEELEMLEPEVEEVKAKSEESTSRLTDLDTSMHNWQSEWDEFNQRASENIQSTEVQKTRIQHLESLLERLAHKKNTLKTDKENIESSVDAQEISYLVDEFEEIEIATEEAEVKVTDAKQQISESRQKRDETNLKLKSEQQKLQQLKGQQISLEALQQAALGKRSEHVSQWLETKGLSNSVRLAEKITVDDGWEIAVETVLGDHLQAVVVDELQDPVSLLSEFSKGALTFIESSATTQFEVYKGSLLPLADKVDGSDKFKVGLQSIFVAETLAEALAARNQLSSIGSIVTRDGIWIGSNWLRISRDADPAAGVLAREKELANVMLQLDEQNLVVEELEDSQQQFAQQLRVLEQSWESQQAQLLQINGQRSEKKRQLESKRMRQQHLEQRQAQLDKELSELESQQNEEQQVLAESRAHLEEFLETMAADTTTREELMTQREERRANLSHVRDQAREDKELVHKLALRTESIKTELNSTKSSQQRAQSQVIEMNERLETLAMALEENEMPIEEMQQDLEKALSLHLEVEQELKQARETLDFCEQHLRKLEKQRLNFEQNLDAVRRKLETEKLQWQSLSVQRENQNEQLKQADQDLKLVLESLAEEAMEESWSQQIAKIAVKIERLGAINLAAIDEYETQSERKTYLDEQNDDLVEALETLESAIRKIDKETRTKFKETFDKINKGLQELFPKVFGGGHAYLELTGEDLLDTGVTIMARPPGKRNSTIHLLSGGEKAMTAIALVFAIFRLNPAPFCMLDEVDAPLDDANVGRFCRMVNEMSETIQFIYISHNKQAIEMAGALVGVTMQEAGVSRMVSVDVGEAVSLVAS